MHTERVEMVAVCRILSPPPFPFKPSSASLKGEEEEKRKAGACMHRQQRHSVHWKTGEGEKRQGERKDIEGNGPVCVGMRTLSSLPPLSPPP